MAKKKELTPEEKLALARARCLQDMTREYAFRHAPVPTYSFNVGDHVRYGAMVSSVVEEVHNDGKCYLLKCVARENNYGHPYEYETYRAVPWYNIRPVAPAPSNLRRNEDVRISFNNSTIESLMHLHYFFGIDLNPDYQRDLVWTQADKEALIGSIFDNVDIGKFCLVHLNSEEWKKRNLSYEILDGKQRLTAILEYYENRFPYKGKYFNDLDGADRNFFLEHLVSVGEVRNADRKAIYNYFLMLNRTGRPMAPEHLQKVEALLAGA